MAELAGVGLLGLAEPSLPIFLSHTISSGSFPSAHETSTSFRPIPSLPLAHTAPKASPTCLNGTRAIPRFAFFGGAGLRDITMSSESTAPKEDKREQMDDAVVRAGCEDNGYFKRIVVSSVPTWTVNRVSNDQARPEHTHQVQEAQTQSFPLHVSSVLFPPPPSLFVTTLSLFPLSRSSLLP